MPMTLVTGGAGYIGSHMVHALLDRGEDVVVLDNLSTGRRALVADKAEFVQGDVGDGELVRALIEKHGIEAAIHFAGSVVVPESVENPLKYYGNNTCASRALIGACVESGVKNFLFSSTAAVYGIPDTPLVNEAAPTQPINPYGRSKLMTEWTLADISAASDLRHIILRYFNVAGADPKGRTGQSTPEATHLIKRAVMAALGRVPALEIFGTDYPTPDGTGVRDYIHVSDLVEAHLLALDALRGGCKAATFNCGYGRGLSVREIIATVERVTGRKLPVRESPRRAGDPPMLVADSTAIQKTLDWKPRYGDAETIVRTAFEWERQLNL